LMMEKEEVLVKGKVVSINFFYQFPR